MRRAQLVTDVSELDGYLRFVFSVLSQHDFAEATYSQGLAKLIVIQNGAIVEILTCNSLNEILGTYL